MSDTVKINQLEVENVKRIRAVQITPAENGLTIIGGDNNQGKTSVLDSILWALGGDRYRPSNPTRDGSNIPPTIRIELSNNIIVERAGKNSALKVIDAEGRRGGQQLLNEFIAELALNLPKFIESSSKEKAATLLQIIGVGDQLFQLEQDEQKAYNQRHTLGQVVQRKKKFAEELTSYPDAPDALISVTELIQKQQSILARNGENQQKRAQLTQLQSQHTLVSSRIEALMSELNTLNAQKNQLEADIATGQKTVAQLMDESTAEIEASLANIETTNNKVRANMEKARAAQEAADLQEQYDALTEDIEKLRKAKTDLLQGANLPLPGLTVENGELLYNGQNWDCMSGSEQLIVATSIVRKLNPKCGFVLVDKLEQFDLKTLRAFGDWLKTQDLQVIATRVSTGDECSILIEDGYSVAPTPKTPAAPTWQAGVF